MNGKLLALIGILVVIVLMVFGSISMYVGAHDRAVEFEGNIKSIMMHQKVNLAIILYYSR